MDFYELMEYLDIEDPAEFIYFETMADLVESERPIDQEAVYALFDGAELETVAELFDDYFEDILDGLPEDSNEIYGLLHQIKLSLMGMAMNSEDEGALRRLTDGFCRFKNWYSEESKVQLYPIGDSGVGSECHTLRDAITTARLEKLGGRAYEYDFGQCLDYPLDSYEISLAALVAAEDADEDESEGIYDHEHLS